MKASIKLRDEEDKAPLLRAKVPISLFSLPFAASATAGEPSDLSINLITSFPSFPSLKLSYHPNPTNPNPNNNPFTLTLKSGAGHLGSPTNSPLHISFRLSPNPNPTFSFTLKPQFGHFSFTKTAAASSLSGPSYPKENGGGVHHPIPMAALGRSGLHDLISGGVGVRVRTEVPVGRTAGLKVRWAVRLPPESRGPGVFGRLPYLTVDKISVERAGEIDEDEEGKKREVREWGEKDLEAMRGMCFWMEREVGEMRNENQSIKEGMEAVKKKFSEVKERNAAFAGDRGITGGSPAVWRRA